MNKSVQDYINEMKSMSIRAEAAPVQTEPVPEQPTEKKPSLNSDGMGELTVVVSSALQRPLQGAAVSVYDSVTDDIVTTQYTDSSGKVGPIFLPAPLKTESMSPTDTLVYGIYDIEVNKDGYIGAVMREIPVFDTVTSIQQISLLLVAAGNGAGEQTQSQGDPFNL